MRSNDLPSSVAFNPCFRAMLGMQRPIDACVKVAELNTRTWREVGDRWQLDAASLRGGKFDFEEMVGLQEWFVEQSLLYSRHLQDIVTQACLSTGQSAGIAVNESMERGGRSAENVGCAAPGLEAVGSPLQTLFAAINESTRRMLDAFKDPRQTTR